MFYQTSRPPARTSSRLSCNVDTDSPYPRLMRPLLVAPLLVLASGCVVIDELECRHREDRQAVVAVPATLAEVEIKALGGSLDVRGQPGASEVRVSGEACARWRRDLEGIQIATRTEGDRVVIEAIIPQSARPAWIAARPHDRGSGAGARRHRRRQRRRRDRRRRGLEDRRRFGRSDGRSRPG